MKAQEKKQAIFGLIGNLEDKGFYPLAMCIGLGECVLSNKSRHAGKDITYYAQLSIDRLRERGMSEEDYNYAVGIINNAKK